MTSPVSVPTLHTVRSFLVFFLFVWSSAPFSAYAQETDVYALPAPRSERELQEAIDALLEQEHLSNAFFGVTVYDLGDEALLYARNAHKSFVPASNAKLYSTAAALDQLGPTYRYLTPLYITGPITDGTVQGDLLVRGSGDPTINGRFHAGDIDFVFGTWADSLRALGVDSIAGRIIGDDNVFDDVALGVAWSWDDLPYWYSAEISGLAYNDNSIDVKVWTRTPGSPPEITWEPFNTSYVTIEDRLTTRPAGSERDETYDRALAGNTFTIGGELPAGAVDRASLAVYNPTAFFVHVLRESLARHGIAVGGAGVDIDALPQPIDYGDAALRRVATYTSPPLADIVEAVNKRSQNLYAEQLLKTLGVERPVTADEPHYDEQRLGSAEMGMAAALRTFVRAGIDTSRFALVDGSGLSRMNLVTPTMTTQLLAYMWNHKDPDIKVSYYRSLPIGGLDGTLRRRFRRGAARGAVRAKTGTLTHVSALSGYVPSAEGTYLAFAFMSNHHTTDADAVRDVQDAFVNLLAQYRR